MSQNEKLFGETPCGTKKRNSYSNGKEGGFYSKQLLHLPTQVVCRQWLKMKYSFVRSANHALQKNVISKARTPTLFQFEFKEREIQRLLAKTTQSAALMSRLSKARILEMEMANKKYMTTKNNVLI